MGDIGDVYGGGFDAEAVDPADSYEPLPVGWYTVMAEKAEVKATKAGNGSYLNIQFTVLDEEYQNRKVFAMITMANPSEKAVAVGMRQLSALSRAVDQMQLTDSADLLNKVLEIKLKVEDDSNYGPSNKVTGYRALEGQQPVQQPAQQPARQPLPTSAPLAHPELGVQQQPIAPAPVMQQQPAAQQPVAAPNSARPWEK